MREIVWARSCANDDRAIKLRAIPLLEESVAAGDPDYLRLRRRWSGRPRDIDTMGVRDGSSKPSPSRNTRDLENN